MLSDWKKILTIRRFHQAGQFAARFFCNFKLLAHHYIAWPALKESLIEKYGLDDGHFTIYGDSKSIMIKILMASNSKIF